MCLFFSLSLFPGSPLVTILVIQFWLKYPEASSSSPLPKPSFQSPLFCVFLCLFYFTFLFFHPPTHTPRVPLLDLPWTTCRWVPLTYQAICHFSRCSWLLCQTSLPLPSLCQNDHHLLLSVGKSMTTQWHTYTYTQKTIWPPKPHLKMPEFNFNSKQKNLPI